MAEGRGRYGGKEVMSPFFIKQDFVFALPFGLIQGFIGVCNQLINVSSQLFVVGYPYADCNIAGIFDAFSQAFTNSQSIMGCRIRNDYNKFLTTISIDMNFVVISYVLFNILGYSL